MATIGEALAVVVDHLTAGRSDAAREICERVLDAAPDAASAHHLMGLILCRDGSGDEGVAALRRAVALTPGAVDPQVNLAKALLGTRRDEVTVNALRHARRLAPMDAELAHHLGALADEGGLLELAGRCWRDLAVIQPALGESWRRLARTSDASNTAVEARAAQRRVAALFPTDAEARNGLGAIARRVGDDGAAIGHFKRALTIDPANVAALSTLGNALHDVGLPGPALTAHRRAARTSGEDATVMWNLAQTALQLGEYGEGWRAYDKRWSAKGFPTPRRHADLPPWTGEDVDGRSVLLYEEQGRGDTIQFCRYARLVADRGATVILEVGADLARLLSRAPGVARVIVTGDAVPPVAFAAPLGSLPGIFGTTLDTIPDRTPYLRAAPEPVAAWRSRMDGAEGPAEGPKVGLVWAGNPEFAGDGRRSPGLAALSGLFTVPGVRLFGLQLGPGHRQLARVGAPAHFTDLASDIRDFDDTAAVMVNLDLVISSCTASAHLAGALGRPVWVALSAVPDWRWLTGRPDSPWYPTARLFRQPTPGDWSSVATRMAAALTELSEGRTDV